MFNEQALQEHFAVRDDIMSVIQKRIDSLKDGYRQNVALTGRSLSGKSSILQHLLANLKDEKLIPVYIEVLEEPFSNFCNKFVGSLLYNFLKGIGHPVKEELDYLINEAKKYIPNTVSVIESIRNPLKKITKEELYSELFGLTSMIKKETQKSCIIIFDEFHNLGALGLKNPFSVFGKRIMIQKDTMYIVTSSKVQAVKKILSEKLSLLFGNFESIEVNGFDTKTAREFLDERFRSIRMPEEYKEFLISFTDGNPFYLDVLSLRLKQMGERFTFKRISEEILMQALHDLIFDFKGIINQYLSNLLEGILKNKNDRENCLSLLLALSSGCNKLSDVAILLKKRKSDLIGGLLDLTEHDIVIKSGSFIVICDKVFMFWLKNVYQKKRNAIISYIPDRSKDFKEDLQKMFNEFVTDSKTDLAEKIQGALHLFDNENIEAGFKKFQLPKFNDIKIKCFGNGWPYLAAFAKDRLYIFFIKDEGVKDIDIMEFSDQCNALKTPIYKKVIIAPSGIDINATLLAKEGKIWVWDLDMLNFLMYIYHKPQIVSFYYKGKKRL